MCLRVYYLSLLVRANVLIYRLFPLINERETTQIMNKLGFGESSDEETLDDWRRAASKKKSVPKEPIVDESVFLYDEHFDELEQQRNNKKQKKVAGGSGPQYINSLLEAKNRRKEDKERLEDVKMAKERELEGDEFKDKEVFLTRGYKEYKSKSETMDDDRPLASGLNAAKKSNKTSSQPIRLEDKKPIVSQPKSRLLPPLTPQVLEEYKQRYLQRKVK